MQSLNIDSYNHLATDSVTHYLTHSLVQSFDSNHYANSSFSHLLNDQVTEIVFKHSLSACGGLDDAALALVNAARDLGSSDNISVVVILFKTHLCHPQHTEESGLLLSFKDVSSTRNFEIGSSNSSTSASNNNRVESKMNDRLKTKAGGEGDKEFFENLVTSIKGISGKHSNIRYSQASSSGVSSTSLSHLAASSSSLSSSGIHQMSANNSKSSNSHSGSNSTSLHQSASSASLHAHGQAAAPSGSSKVTLTSAIHQTPFSHELMRQALFYICNDKRRPSQGKDSQLVAMALSRAMSGEKQGQRRKKTSGRSQHESGKYARNSSVSIKSPRRPSVRTMSRVSQMSSSRNRALASVKGGGSKRRQKSKKLKGGGADSSKLHLGETLWTSDEEDALSVRSQAFGRGGRFGSQHPDAMPNHALSWSQASQSARHHKGGVAPWRIEPASLSLQSSTPNISLGSLNLSRQVPTLLGKSLPLGNRSNVLPGIGPTKYLSSSSEDVSHLKNSSVHNDGSINQAVVGNRKRPDDLISLSSSSVTGGPSTRNTRPALGKGYSVMSDSYAIRRSSKASTGMEDFKFETSSQYGDSELKLRR